MAESEFFFSQKGIIPHKSKFHLKKLCRFIVLMNKQTERLTDISLLLRIDYYNLKYVESEGKWFKLQLIPSTTENHYNSVVAQPLVINTGNHEIWKIVPQLIPRTNNKSLLHVTALVAWVIWNVKVWWCKNHYLLISLASNNLQVLGNHPLKISGHKPRRFLRKS